MLKTFDNWQKSNEAKWAELKENDFHAQCVDSLVGRYITVNYEDSKAVYLITRENFHTIEIVHVQIDDGWEFPDWGKKAILSREVTEKLLAAMKKAE